MNDLDAIAGEFFEPAQHLAVLEREALVGAADQLAFGPGRGLPSFPAKGLDGFRHVGRIEEPRVVRVDDGTERRGPVSHTRELAIVVFPAAGIKGAFALLHEPQAHDVFEQPIGAVQAAFVGQIQRLRARAQGGLLNLDPHERPGAGAQVCPVGFARVGRGHPGDRSGGIMRRRRHHVDFAQAGALRDAGPQHAQPGAGRHDFRKNARGQAKLFQQAGGPVAGQRVQALGGGAVGEFDHTGATQRPMDEVRHQQQRVRPFEHLRSALFMGQQLEQGVELHELQAGLGKDFRPRHFSERLFHHAVGAGVAIRERLPQHFVALIEQHIVHPPGVGTDRYNPGAILPGGQAQAVLDFRPQPHDVPAERVAQIDGAIGEPMNFFETDGLAIPKAGHKAAAFRAKVNRQVGVRHKASGDWGCGIRSALRAGHGGRAVRRWKRRAAARWRTSPDSTCHCKPRLPSKTGATPGPGPAGCACGCWCLSIPRGRCPAAC